MARFARDCVAKIEPLLETLGRELGPDTVDLGVRIGLHSGPVTAGVLRGDRARFQLFGDVSATSPFKNGFVTIISSPQLPFVPISPDREHCSPR